MIGTFDLGSFAVYRISKLGNRFDQYIFTIAMLFYLLVLYILSLGEI